jgi:hypothetical protein
MSETNEEGCGRGADAGNVAGADGADHTDRENPLGRPLGNHSLMTATPGTPDFAAVALETLARARERADDVYCSVFSHWDSRDGIPWATARVAHDLSVAAVEGLTDPHARLMALLEHPNAEVREAAMCATGVTA